MARNKYPEETVAKILEVSGRLFSEKGYDHTTIQDIVNALGMSKGAVYHHFKSKEDILDKLSNAYYDEIRWFYHIREDKSLTGLEKFRKMLIFMLSDQKKLDIDHMSMSIKLDPRMLALMLESTMKETCPFTQVFVEEGLRDGSITTGHPKELNEVLMLLFNIWVGIYTNEREDFMRKMLFLKAMTDSMGLPLINQEVLDTAERYFDNVLALVRKRGWTMPGGGDASP